jgi:hypothetical protein
MVKVLTHESSLGIKPNPKLGTADKETVSGMASSNFFSDNEV